MNLEHFAKTAQTAACKASELLIDLFGHLNGYTTKSSPYDLVTEADQKAEQVILSVIQKHHPSHRILSEEQPPETIDWDDFLWVIDPLDGTTNYAHKYPFFCVSIALVYKKTPLVGVVFAPLLHLQYAAVKGNGATCNGAKIRVSSVQRIRESLFATGFAYRRESNTAQIYRDFAHLTQISHGVRRDGSAALDLAFVASGKLEGFWERALKPWDIAAGALIVEEAGGVVSTVDGSPLDLERGDVLAANPEIHPQLLGELTALRSSE
ncbi:MAG: inositol monophosphatase [Chlamydiia bacterium]|nr:inositol monophosphatase [Chlamydiia bacterium]